MTDEEAVVKRRSSRLGDLRDYVFQRQQQLRDIRIKLHAQRAQSQWRIFGPDAEDDAKDAENEKLDAQAWAKIEELDYMLEKINQLAVHGFNEEEPGA